MKDSDTPKTNLDPPSADAKDEQAEEERRLDQYFYRAELAAQRAEGRAEGRAEALRLILARRFGALPPSVEQRLRDAGAQSLDVWIDRLLDAKSLEDVLAEP